MITQPAPSKETIYQISYPRSGKSWFSYCVNNVVDFGGSIDHAQAHYLVPHEGNEKYNIKGHFDLYCVFLLRDYKEALISNFPFGNSPLHLAKYMWTRESHVPVKEEMRLLSRSTVENASIDALLHHMMMMAKERSASTGHFAKTSEFEKLFYELFYLLGEEHCESLTFTEFLLEHACFPRFDPYRKRNLIESIHQDKPFNQIMEAQHNGQSIVENSVEIRTLSSPIYHYYLAVQLERYYTLLEYWDVCSGIRFSIDGASKEVYEKIRSGGRWDVLLENLEIAKHKLLSKNNYYVVIAMTVSKDNVHEIGEFIVKFKEYVPNPSSDLKFGLVNSLAPNNEYFDNVNLFKNHTFQNVPCGFGFTSAQVPFVLVDGRYSICCRDYDGSLVIGDIKSGSLKDAYSSNAMQEIKKAHEANDVSAYSLCNTCFQVDERVNNAFAFLVKLLIHKFPAGHAEFYQEKVDRFVEIFQDSHDFRARYESLVRTL